MIVSATTTTIEIAPLSSSPPAFATPSIQDAIAGASSANIPRQTIVEVDRL